MTFETAKAHFDVGMNLIAHRHFAEAMTAFEAAVVAAGPRTFIEMRSAYHVVYCIQELSNAADPGTEEGAALLRRLSVRLAILAPTSGENVAGERCAALLLRAAHWRFDLYARWGDLLDIDAAGILAARAAQSNNRPDELCRLQALSLLVHARHRSEEDFPDLPDRADRAAQAVDEAREVVRLVSGGDAAIQRKRFPLQALQLETIPSEGSPLFDLALTLRAYGARTQSEASTREALDLLATVEDMLEHEQPTAQRAFCLARVFDLEAVCWLDLQDAEPQALDRAREFASAASRLLQGDPDVGEGSIVLRRRADIHSAHARLTVKDSDASIVDKEREAAYRLYAAAWDLPASPAGRRRIAMNWLNLAVSANDTMQLKVAGWAALSAIREQARAQSLIETARRVVTIAPTVGGLLVDAYLADDDLWFAAAAIEHSRALILDTTFQSEVSATVDQVVADTTRTIRSVSASRCLCYIFESSAAGEGSPVCALVFRPQCEPLLLVGGGLDAKVRLMGHWNEAMNLFNDGVAPATVPSLEHLLRSTASESWDLIVRAVVAACEGHTEIAFVAVGALAFLPLGLSGPTDGPSLLDAVAPTFPLSARHLLDSDLRWRQPDGKALVIASVGNAASPLRSVEAERDAVALIWRAHMLDVATVQTRLEAARGLAGAQIVHAVCHHRAHLGDPSSSALVLDDGLLLLADTKLDASLVFLAACETGRRGAYESPDEALSLSSIMQRRGAAVVISTEWDVQGYVAKAIALLFYEGLLSSGLDPAQALRRAQLRLRDGDLKAGVLTEQLLEADVAKLRLAGTLFLNWGGFTICGSGRAITHDPPTA